MSTEGIIVSGFFVIALGAYGLMGAFWAWLLGVDAWPAYWAVVLFWPLVAWMLYAVALMAAAIFAAALQRAR